MPVKEVWEGNYHDYTDVARQGHFHIRAGASLVTKHPNLGLLPNMGETKGTVFVVVYFYGQQFLETAEFNPVVCTNLFEKCIAEPQCLHVETRQMFATEVFLFSVETTET